MGPFVIEEELGEGAMGLVFRARHVDGSLAAVKVISRTTSSSSRRFQREGNALRALDHPNVVRYLGSSGGPPSWLAMEYASGGTLPRPRAPMPWMRLRSLLLELLDALAHGAPPHAGIALGLDRLVAMICDCDSIRDVIAFPKTQRAACLLTEAPSRVDSAQLRSLGIRVDA